MTQVIDHSLTKFAAVTLMQEAEFPEVVKTLRAWKHYLLDYLSKITPDAQTRAMSSDYQVVITLFQEDLWKIKKSVPKIVLIARDNFSRIQAMSCFTVAVENDHKRLQLHELISAPWNVRWPVKPFAYPLYGGGVLMFHALIIYAGKHKATSIALSSTPSSVSFYKRLGLVSGGFNRFTLFINEEHTAVINELFQKHFAVKDEETPKSST